jgi:hypothetical protein
MTRPMMWLLVALVAAPAVAQAPRQAMLTIYSQDLAFVRETRSLSLDKARDTVRIGDLPDRLDFSSLQLAPAGRARVSRLAYQFDVASGDRAIERARGRRVRVALKGERVIEGTLIATDAAWLTIRGADGALETVSRAAVEDVRIPDPPRDLAFEPRLEAVIENGTPGRMEAELSYLTGGLSWGAEHRLQRTGEKTAEWSSVVTVENASGRSYEVSKLVLVAGDPRRTGPAPPPMPVMRAYATSAMEAKADLGEQTFAEYHLYVLDRRALLRDRETQTLSMIETRTVQVTPRYLARPGAGVAAQLELENAKAAGLGVPLPGGRVRFYERDASGDEHFTGETRIHHTPEGEKLTLDVGTAFDLVAERREMYNRRISDREREVRIEVKLRNRKKTAVTIVVEEPVSGDHEVIQKSHEPVRKDANTLQFSVPVAPGKEEVLTYTVRQRY